MQLIDIINKDLIQFDVEVATKKKALQLIGDLFVAHDPSLDSKEIYHGLLDREKLGSTYVGYGIAIPHCKYPNLSEPLACLIRFKNYIDFSSSNIQKVNIVFSLILPDDDNNHIHINMLSKIASFIDDKKLRDKLNTAKNPEEVFDSINEYSKEYQF